MDLCELWLGTKLALVIVMNLIRSKKLLSFTLLIGASLLIQACGKDVAPEPSCDFVQNSRLQRVSWKGQIAKMYIHSSVPQEYHSVIRSAADVWNSEVGVDVISIETVVGGQGKPTQDGYNIIYWMNTWDAKKKSEQARTTIYWKGSHIYEADIRINDKNHNFSLTKNAESGKVDFYSLMVHEMGHVLGLAHIEPEAQSVMHAYLSNGTERRSLFEKDQSTLKCEYGS